MEEEMEKMKALFGKLGVSQDPFRCLGRVVGVLVCLAFASVAVAQLDTGTISGTVSDQSGAATPGAAITIRNLETGVSRKLEADARGRYEAAALPGGPDGASATFFS